MTAALRQSEPGARDARRRRLARVVRVACASTVLVAIAPGGATAVETGPAASIDPRIAALQITMRSRLLYRGPVTGFADARTTTATAILQQRLGVAADGVFGPQTRARLFPFGTPVLGRRLLTVGSKGYDVALLRVELAFHG